MYAIATAPIPPGAGFTTLYLIRSTTIYPIPADTIVTHQTNSLYVDGFVKTTGFLKLP